MTIVIEDPGIERLVRRIAASQGVSVEKLVHESLVTLASQRSVAANDREQPLRDRLAALAREVDAIPRSADPRTDDQILGYDERGVW